MDISRQGLSVGILSGLLQYFSKNRTILVQKLEAEKKLFKSVSGYFMTRKNTMTLLMIEISIFPTCFGV